ncbi:hypothetical protein ABVK25_007608 [Lepraria finkii]|uniref:Sorting nexin MVP1 n=1 Tax=Lepraria finkii TaxID=1340010 RepID=A0ABR4B2M3_9LECA
MALFGSSLDDSSLSAAPTRDQKSSLFDDEQPPSTKSGNSLFDDEGVKRDSPWSMPTPKRVSKSELVKTLLPASDVPESYIDAFDTLVDSGYKVDGGKIGIAGVKKIFDGSSVYTSNQDKILKLVTGGQGNALGRNEFNVLLALIGLSQENEEASLDSVDERRKSLPEPSLPYIKQARTAKVSENLENTSPKQQESNLPAHQTTPGNSPSKSRRLRKDSLENLDDDPWASPALHRGHTHIVNSESTPSNTTSAKPLRNGLGEPSRTTSTFTTHSEEPVSTPMATEENAGGLGWGSGAPPSGGFPGSGQSGLGGGGFGSSGDGQGNNAGGSLGRSLGGGRTINRGIEETVTVTLLPEKEGMFMFQHHNYEVKSARRASTVIRRYSDFVWLLDCLHKRYPFRQLPLLPPKRVAVNGRHLSADVTFIEKRRRGLVRFLNALVRHPVLSQEQLVVMFLTVPTELAVWRKQATISVQEEFTGKSLPPGLEDSLPTNLSDTFDTVRSGVRQASESYIGLCNLMERLSKRNQGVAADSLRFSQALLALTESSPNTYATDTNDVPLLNEGISSTAKHLTTSQSLLEDEARAWDEGVLEDLKKQRDTLVSVRDLFDRRDRYAKDNIPYLERRIESNKNKLDGLMRPEGSVAKPGEKEKLEQAVKADEQSIDDQRARGVFIKECIRDELLYFQQSQYHVSRLHQEWSQERVKYAELQADNWRALSEEVENMPLGE